VYVPRQPHECDAAVLVRRHLPGFLARLEEAGHALPEFVKEGLAEFAGCGDFERGFVQTMCRLCGDELRVPFSCKGRGFCSSCMGRRMAEGAALLVDHVLPAVGYRQWVLSFEGPLAVRVDPPGVRAGLEDRSCAAIHGPATRPPLAGTSCPDQPCPRGQPPAARARVTRAQGGDGDRVQSLKLSRSPSATLVRAATSPTQRPKSPCASRPLNWIRVFPAGSASTVTVDVE